MKPFSVAFKGWLLVIIPIVVEAGHHPGHGGTESAGGGSNTLDPSWNCCVRRHHGPGGEKKEVNWLACF